MAKNLYITYSQRKSEVKLMETNDESNTEWREMDLQAASMQLYFFLSRADDIHNRLIEGFSGQESLAASLPSFLFSCQPFFDHLESSVRSTSTEMSPLSKSTFLYFSETLVNKLEKLLLTFASKELLSLDETEPNSISHFHIGQFGLGPLKVTIFRFSKPMPYLCEVNVGLYKRMRWNVDRTEDTTQQEQGDMHDTEYYYLCSEDVSTLSGGDSVSSDRAGRVWSIGQWIQVSPETNDINDWVLCRIPQATYLKRVILGSEEPSCRSATDCLQQLLMLDLKDSS